jgi:hypothetical protein
LGKNFKWTRVFNKHLENRTENRNVLTGDTKKKATTQGRHEQTICLQNPREVWEGMTNLVEWGGGFGQGDD